jgi:hypothetical protein
MRNMANANVTVKQSKDGVTIHANWIALISAALILGSTSGGFVLWAADQRFENKEVHMAGRTKDREELEAKIDAIRLELSSKCDHILDILLQQGRLADKKHNIEVID